MSKKPQRRRKSKRRQPPPRQFPWIWLAVGGAVALIAGALMVLRPWSGGDEPGDVQAGGTPRLMVDQTLIDEGYVRYDVPIRTTFRLSNVGDGPLKILSNPQVSLVQGC